MGVRDDVPTLVDDESGTASDRDERVAVDRVVDLLRAVVIGVRRLVAAWEFIDARDLGHVGKSFDPGETTEIGLTDRLQVEDGDDRRICLLRDVGDRHLGRLRRCRGAKRGAGPAVDHRLRGDLCGKNASRQDAKPGCAEDEHRRQCPGQGHPAQAAYSAVRPYFCSLVLPTGINCPATDTEK